VGQSDSRLDVSSANLWGQPEDTPVVIETDKNLLGMALVEAGFTVYPINP